MARESTSIHLALGAALLLLAGLSLPGLDAGPLTPQESRWLTDPALTGPLFGLLLAAWSALSQDPFWLRTLPLAAALTALVIARFAARQLGGAHATAGALVLVAAAPLLVWQATQLGPDTLILALALGSIWCFAGYARQGDIAWLAGWTLSTAAGLLVRPEILWAVLIQWIAALLYRRRLHLPQGLWWLAQLGPIVLFLIVWNTPMLAGTTVPSLDTLVDRWMVLATGAARPGPNPGAILFGLLALFGLAAARDARRDARRGLLVLGAFIPTLLFFFLPGGLPYATGALACWCMLIAMGLRLHPRWLRQLLWSGLALSWAFSYWQLYG
ncbi:MAG: hypothetical protein GKR89_36525 [Candidatus Latescibacteria bacterium]|nr:hypothetical protein [Candidatus Latescibacterota bacterium]